MKKLMLLLIMMVLLMVGCGDDAIYGGDSNCDNKIQEWIEEHGYPNKINEYIDEDYHSCSYRYWCKGLKVTFKWGKHIDGCEISTSTFDPTGECD